MVAKKKKPGGGGVIGGKKKVGKIPATEYTGSLAKQRSHESQGGRIIQHRMCDESITGTLTKTERLFQIVREKE